MIPRLLQDSPTSPLYASFLDTLRSAGFEGDLSTSHADRTVLSTDNSIYQRMPQAVVYPRSVEDVRRIARAASEPRFHEVKVVARGGGTGTNAQSLTDGVVVDLSRHMNRILEINVEERWARVEPGVVKDQLGAAVARHGLFFPPELSTSNRATIGGMVNTDASGQGSCIYGKTRDHVLELTTVFLDGTLWKSLPVDNAELGRIRARGDRVAALHAIVDDVERENRALVQERFPKLNRCLTGYDLAHVRDANGRFDLNSVLVGSEGTLGFVVEAKVNLLPIPPYSALVNLRYGDFDGALRDVTALMEYGAASIETVDGTVLALARNDIVWHDVREFFPDDPEGPAQAVNLIEFVGYTEDEVQRPLRKLLDALRREGSVRGRRGYTIAEGAGIKKVWSMRKKGVGLLGNLDGEARPIPFIEDTSVPPVHLADYIAELRAALDARGLKYGMFGHADAGVLHVRPAIDMKDAAQEPLIRIVTDEAARLTAKYGGLLWGEHGKGVRSEFAPTFFGPLYPELQKIKAVFDPHHQLNPGKIATPPGSPLLKIDGLPTRGQRDRTIPAPVRHAFEGAVECNGNGLCFNFDADDPMCPSWKATRDRRHSPKGRAGLVREWLALLAASGTDPVAERKRGAGLLTWPVRVRNSLASRFGEKDFSHEVKAAMDECLSCKACGGQCPIKVDIPEMRSSFLELYHGRYLRPLRDWLISYLESVLPLLARMAFLYNLAAGSRLGRAISGWLGITGAPKLSTIDFDGELRKRGIGTATPAKLAALSAEERAQSVVVVQDAFTRYFEAPLVLDVLDLLATAGLRPWLAPFRANGKALHIHGFRSAFTRVARRGAALLRELAATGVPLVGVDPAMTLCYRGEYAHALGPNEAPPVLLLQEFLAQRLPRLRTERSAADSKAGPPKREYRLLGHCTEKTNAPESQKQWQQVFERFGVGLRIQATGCCGMAGTYGHLQDHRATSERIYEMSWRPQVAAISPEAPAVATGYSCRAQAKLVDASVLPHPAQALLAELRRAD